MKINQSQDDYIKHLSEQLQFLINSCNSFDQGFTGEAKRIATTIRVLLHDTHSSTSLLTQLNAKNTDYYNTASEYDPRNMISHMGLLGLRLNTLTGGGYFPHLDDFPNNRKNLWVTFEKWWDGTIILSDNHNNVFTRKELILVGANKDGGAHVDSKLDHKYAQLSRENSVGWNLVVDDIETPLPDPHLYSIRQMGHEIIKTLNHKFPELKNSK